MTSAHPLLCNFKNGALVALFRNRPVSVEEFLAEAASLAAMLPAHRYLVNLCTDRYRFTVGLAAALMRGQISLMPQSDRAQVLADLATQFPDLHYLHDGDSPPGPSPVLTYPAFELAASLEAPIPTIPTDQPAVVLFTSGSSGTPVPHLKTWGELVTSARAAGARLGVAALSEATVIGTVPQQHSYGLESTVMLALQHGLVLHGDRPFYPEDIATCITETPRPRILVTTPVHLRAMLAGSDRWPPVDLIVSATAPLAPQLAQEAEARLGAPLLEIYGCSEAGQLATRRTTQDETWHCLEGIHFVQGEGRTWVLGAREGAEILLGDVIELRGADRFLLFGRQSDLINIAGKRTSLVHLNHHLNSVPGVRDGVFVMPEERDDRTTRLMAFVVAPGLTRDAILADLRRRVDAAFLPRPLLLVDTLPRNSLGKLTREAALKLAGEQSR